MKKVTVEDYGFFLRCIPLRTINPYTDYVLQTADKGIPTISQEVGKENIEIK